MSRSVRLSEWMKQSKWLYGPSPTGSSKPSTVYLSSPGPDVAPPAPSGLKAMVAAPPATSVFSSSSFAPVSDNYRRYVHGAGAEQEAFDQVILLLLRAAGSRTEPYDGEQATHDLRIWRVQRVQAINDTMSDEEAIAWYQRAIELSL